jgi:hypothetical protein
MIPYVIYHRQTAVKLYLYCTPVLLFQYILECFELYVGVCQRLYACQIFKQ